MKTTNLKFKIIGIAVLAVLLVLAISGIVSAFSKGQSGNTDEITYIDKTTNGNIDITFSEDGDLVFNNAPVSKNDVYFAGSKSNFLNFRQQKTYSQRFSKYSYTNYELEILAYSDAECKDLVKYVISWGEKFELYQVIKFDKSEQGSYLTTLGNNYKQCYEVVKGSELYIGGTDKGEYDGVVIKGLNNFEMSEVLYFNNGDYVLELGSDKDLLEVFTIMLKSLVSSNNSVSSGSHVLEAVNITSFCDMKIYNEEMEQFQSVTNKVCLNTSFTKFERTSDVENIVLLSEVYFDFPNLIAEYRAPYWSGSGSSTIAECTGYVIKY